MIRYIVTNKGIATYYDFPPYHMGPWYLPSQQLSPFEQLGHHFHYQGQLYGSKYTYPYMM